MKPDIWIDLPSPFGLARPTKAWCQTIAEFDPDLRIFPSQTHNVYRLMRLSHNTPIAAMVQRMAAALKQGILKEVHPDTKIAIAHKLIAVFTLPAHIVTVSPDRVVAKLKARDQWAFKDGDAVADALDKQDDVTEAAVDAARRQDIRARRRMAGISLLYRTGGRVSLVSPRRHQAGTDSLGTPGGDKAVTVSPTE